MNYKTCSFFGHRNVVETEELKCKLTEVIEDLIVNHNVLTFLFGSRSDFDSICHLVVTELKEKYTEIKRIKYTCRHETCVLESERAHWEKVYSFYKKAKVTLLGVEEEHGFKTKYTAGRLSYVERNQEMINDSDYCVFYYDENYKPPIRRVFQKGVGVNEYQPKSGTELAYNYAKQKKKTIINIYNKSSTE